jgi:hypothetical protein
VYLWNSHRFFSNFTLIQQIENEEEGIRMRMARARAKGISEMPKVISEKELT